MALIKQGAVPQINKQPEDLGREFAQEPLGEPNDERSTFFSFFFVLLPLVSRHTGAVWRLFSIQPEH